MLMKLYPKNEASLCAHAGGVDPKTIRKWVWQNKVAISDLKFTLVSAINSC